MSTSPYTQNYSLPLLPSLRADLNALAAVRGEKPPELMRRLLLEAIEQHRPQLEAFRELQNQGKAA